MCAMWWKYRFTIYVVKSLHGLTHIMQPTIQVKFLVSLILSTDCSSIEAVMVELDFNMLPGDCVSSICSLTSPEDASRLSLVSSSFRSAAESDMVWERFLPSDYRDILARAIIPLKFSSKKELFFQLCDSIVLDGGRKVSS